MIRTSIDSLTKEKHITWLISDIIFDKGKPQSAAADSATQASVLAMEHKSRCFLERPCSGTIITATGRKAGAIKFQAETHFPGNGDRRLSRGNRLLCSCRHGHLPQAKHVLDFRTWRQGEREELHNRPDSRPTSRGGHVTSVNRAFHQGSVVIQG